MFKVFKIKGKIFFNFFNNVDANDYSRIIAKGDNLVEKCNMALFAALHIQCSGDLLAS